MKLATIQDVLDRMNLSGNLVNNPTAIASALDGATTLVESILQTSLAASEQIDYFSVSYSSYSIPSRFMFWLKKGFVKNVSGFYTSTDGSRLGDVSGLTPVDSVNYTVSEDIGQVVATNYLLRGECNVAIQYTSGFSDNDVSIPSDLKEAAISAAVYIVNAQSIIHGKKDKEAQLDTKSRLHGLVYAAIKERIVSPFGGYYPYKSTNVVAV